METVWTIVGCIAFICMIVAIYLISNGNYKFQIRIDTSPHFGSKCNFNMEAHSYLANLRSR
jgi:hypothetical protein